MMRARKRILPLTVGLGAAVLTACSTTGGYGSPEYRLPEGSTVELMETLEFSPNSTRVFIQGGVQMRGRDVDLWQPHCSFNLKRGLGEAPRAVEIQPTRFSTGKASLGVRAALDNGGGGNGYAVPEGLPVIKEIRVAGLFGGAQGGGTPWPYTYYTTIPLYSEDAPRVQELTCAYQGSAAERNITVDVIQETLGDVARVY
jgi:predicted small secreted protein